MADYPAQTDASTLPSDSLVGSTVGRYKVTKSLGAGGMGEVYVADDPVLKRKVAIKRIAPQLRTDKEYRARFLREAERASVVKSSHVAAVYDALELNGQLFLVMEYVEGRPLRERLHEPVSIGDFLKIAEQCAEALQSAHRERIVHCDIKPENIMVEADDAVKVLDFGVAKRLPGSDQSTTMDRGQSGTPSYMAPEVLRNQAIDGRADLFSLGIVFYEMLTARHPFAAKSFAEVIDAILKERPRAIREINNAVPEAIEVIVKRMLAKRPDDRYANATELLAALRTVLSKASTGSLRAAASKKRIAWQFVLGIAAVVLAVAGLLRWHKEQTVAPTNALRQLAVLPFNATSDNAGTRAFSDGLTETLTTKLTQLREDYGLLVIPSREVRDESVRSADQARRVFGANLVLEGSLEQSGEVIRINYMLVDARNRQPLHAEVITESIRDPFGVEDKVVASVLKALDVELRGQDRTLTAIRGTSKPEAYDYYLRGIGYLHESQKPEHSLDAIDVFRASLNQDPRYALAWAGLGRAYWQQYENTRERKWVDEANAACKRAESLDRGLAATHICSGTVLKGTGEYNRAVEEFKEAIAIDPTNDDAIRELAESLQQQGKTQDAEAAYEQAIHLRPQSWLAYDRIGIFYDSLGRYSEAANAFRKVIQLAPDGHQGYNNLGGMELAQGRYEEAIPLLLRSAEVRPTSTAYSNLGAAYVYLKRYDDAVRAYEQSVKMPEAGYDEWGNLAEAYYYSPNGRERAEVAYRKAIVIGGEQLRVNARDTELLSSLGLYHAMIKEREPALRYLNQALGIASGDNNVLFNAAKTENALGNSDKALQYLGRAIASGYSKYYAKDDPVFESLRQDPGFRRLVGEP